MNTITTEEVTYCAVHPDRETSLRCNKCDRLMCSKCAVQTPVGYRCRECIRQIESGFYNANEADMIITFVVCAVLTGIGSAVIAALGIPIFFMLILGLPLGGGVVAEAALRLTKRKRARNSAYIAVAGVIAGGLIGGFLHAYITLTNALNEVIAQSGGQLPPEYAQSLSGSTLEYALQSTLSNINLLLFIGIVAFGVYGRYRMRS